jgi:hypothetical protein
MGFQEGGQYLPGDYVDKGKLLLFIKDEVASYTPYKGQRLKAEQARRKRKRLEPGPRPVKRRRGALSPKLEGSRSSTEDDGEGEGEGEGEDSDNNSNGEPASDLLLIYNSIRSYCSVINKLWAHQTSYSLHTAPRPQRVALTALKTSIIRG